MSEPSSVSASLPIAPAGLAWLRALLLAAWAAVSFGGCYFARELDAFAGGWPFGYWWAAQGALVAFTGLVAANAWLMNRAERRQAVAPPVPASPHA